ncbi:MAG: hypothetical protein ACK5H1_07985 [Tenacibaculum sp.]
MVFNNTSPINSCIIKPDCPEGFAKDKDGNCVKKPCKGDSVLNVETVSSGFSELKVGTFDCTRINFKKICEGVKGRKKHNGLDIKAKVNTSTFSMYKGIVISVRTTFYPLYNTP